MRESREIIMSEIKKYSFITKNPERPVPWFIGPDPSLFKVIK